MSEAASAPAESRFAASTTRNEFAHGLVVLLFLLLVIFLAIRQLEPPAALDANAPPDVFSAGRALKHLQVIARAPHPVGSQEHDAVRDYVFGELAAQGLTPDIQTTTAIGHPQAVPLRIGNVQNIMGRLRGTANTKAVMLVCHYDSVATGPGAGDDGAAVAALLETARALKAGAPLKNDVVFLFTDAEEVGLLGAQAFASEHAAARDVGVLFNFEARGSAGPSVMFETSDGNGWLIEEFARGSQYPVATSLYYEIYKLLPNDTDLTIFKSAGLAGLNFAYVDDYSRYHMRTDSVENLDTGSLQHHGSNSLSMARHFGNLTIGETRAANAVYFNLFGKSLIHYPGWLVLPLTVLAVLAFAGVVMLGFKKRLLTPGGIGLGFLSFLLGAIAMGVVITLTLWLVRFLQRGQGSAPWGQPYNAHFYVAGFVLLACAVVWAIYNLFLKKTTAYNLAVGGLIWWLLLTIAVSVLMPGGSYLLQWPLLFALGGLALLFIWHDGKPLARMFVLALCALPCVLLLAPIIYLVFIALTYNAAATVLVLLVLMLGLLVPQYALIAGRRKWLLPLASLVIGVGFVVAGLLTGGYDANHPSMNNIFYGLNADTGKATWASFDARPDEWTAQFFPQGGRQDVLPEFITTTDLRFLQTEAQSLPLPPPELTTLADTTENDVRTLRLRITSPRQAQILTLQPDAGFEPRAATINGKTIDFKNGSLTPRGREPWRLQYYAFPAGGAELTLSFKSSQPFKIRLTDRTYGLPQGTGLPRTPRPPEMMPLPVPLSDATVVSKTFSF